MTGTSHLELLAEAIHAKGIDEVATIAGCKPAKVHKFLQTGDMTVSIWARLALAVDLPIGRWHLISLTTAECLRCRKNQDAHQPLFPSDDVELS